MTVCSIVDAELLLGMYYVQGGGGLAKFWLASLVRLIAGQMLVSALTGRTSQHVQRFSWCHDSAQAVIGLSTAVLVLGLHHRLNALQ